MRRSSKKLPTDPNQLAAEIVRLSTEEPEQMKCEICGQDMVERRTTIETPYAYTLSGLPVGLSGIRVCTCGVCGEEMPIIPRIEELHDLIAEMVCRKANLLSGDEIRFLRKHAGYPAKDFARLLRMDASHLSRVENGHTLSLGKQADILARALVIATTRVGDAARDASHGRWHH